MLIEPALGGEAGDSANGQSLDGAAPPRCPGKAGAKPRSDYVGLLQDGACSCRGDTWRTTEHLRLVIAWWISVAAGRRLFPNRTPDVDRTGLDGAPRAGGDGWGGVLSSPRHLLNGVHLLNLKPLRSTESQI